MAWEPNKPLVIEEIEVAPPQANEVRMKVRDVHNHNAHFIFMYTSTELLDLMLLVLISCEVQRHTADPTESQHHYQPVPLFVFIFSLFSFCLSYRLLQLQCAIRTYTTC